MQDDDTCAFCCQESETITHLLVGCSFSREVWFAALQSMGWQSLAPPSDSFSLADWWASARKCLLKDDRRKLDSIIILVSWILWLERNKRVFDRQARSAQQLLSLIADEAVQWGLAGYTQVEALAVALGRRPGRAITFVT